MDLPMSSDITKARCCKTPKLEPILFQFAEEPSITLGKCYDGYVDIFKYYLDFPEHLYKFLSLWCVSTYFYDEFETFPILFFNAMRGSAKTRTSKLVNYLACKGTGRTTNNVSESAFFRHPTGVPMALDEVERIGTKELMGLRELINAVYKKGSRVQRVKKVREKNEEKFVLDEYEPRFPLTIANISGLEEVLEDRGFCLVLEKSDNIQFVNLLEDWEQRTQILEFKRTLEQVSVVSVVSLRKKMYTKFWNDYIKHDTTTLTTQTTQTTQTTLETSEREEFFLKMLESGITGRNFELAFPLLIISKLISEDVFKDTLEIIKTLINEKKTNEYLESRDVALFDFVANQPSSLDFISTKDLVMKFRAYIGEGEEWLNEKWFGKSLKRLNLILDKKRMASGRFVILNTAKAKEKLKMFGDKKHD